MTERPVDADVASGVEWAERGPDFERRVGEVAGVRGLPDPAAPELADDDVVVERKDPGPESGTFIAKGDPIPAELRGLPRRAARSAPRKK
jgi:hypothetical protein